MSGLKANAVDAVEVFGDATRTPILLEVTKKVFGKQELFRTLNSLEAVARGAALQSAFLSPAFSTAAFKVDDFNNLPVEVKYGDTDSEERKTAELYPKKSYKFPNNKTITFNNKVGKMTILLKYKDEAEVLPGLPMEIAQYQIGEGKLKHQEKSNASFGIEYTLEHSGHQIPWLKEASLLEKWEEEEKIAIKKPAAPAPPKPEEKKDESAEKKDEEKPAQPQPETVQEYETKIKKKQTSTPLQFNTSFFGLLPDKIKHCKEIEQKLHTADRKFLDLKESKNQLETVCYKYRDNLNGKMAPFMQDGARETVL